MNDYKIKKQAKIERLLERADKADKESEHGCQSALDALKGIVPGQPILVGHHSEKRHRRAIEKSDNQMRKGYEAGKKAEELRRRAEAKENNTAISSDDPEAITKLRTKIEALENRRDTIKNINKEFKKLKGDPSKIDNMNDVPSYVKNAIRENINTKIGYGERLWIPFEAFELTNLGANIRDCKKRLEYLEKQLKQKTVEYTINEVRVLDNVEDNRLQLFFPGKPDENIRTALKKRAFKWSPTNGCWQRQRSNNANYAAKEILKMLVPGE